MKVQDSDEGDRGGIRRRKRGRPRLTGMVTCFVALLLVASACGDDTDDDSSEADAGDTTVTTAATSDGDGDGDGDGDSLLPPRPLDERQTLRITIPARYETFATVFVAEAMGEFDKENLDVEIIDAPTTDALPMLSAGQIQVQGCGPSVGFINAIASGIDIVWVAPNSTPPPEDEPGVWVSNELLDESGEVDPDKLLEATVGLGSLQMGSSNALPVSQWLATIGLELTDLTLSPLNGGDLLAAFTNGAVQAAWLNSPLWEPVKASGEAARVQGQGDAPLGGYCLGPNREDDAPAIEAFLRAMARTNGTHLSGDYHQDDEVVEVISEALGISAADIRKAPALVFDPELKLDPSVAVDLQDIWLDVGVLELDEPLAESQLVDQTLVTAALS